MSPTQIPEAIRKLAWAPLLHEMFGQPTSCISFRRVREVHAAALGPGHRKRTAHFALQAERDVLDSLRVQGFTLFLPKAEATLRSAIEDGRLTPPEIGKRYSVYAMLPGERFVALVRHDEPLGIGLLEGQFELPYDRAAEEALSQLIDPVDSIVCASILDAHAIYTFSETR